MTRTSEPDGPLIGTIFREATGTDPRTATRAQVGSWRRTVNRLTSAGLVSQTEGRARIPPGRPRLLCCVAVKLTRSGVDVCWEIAADLASDRSVRWDVVCKRIERKKSRSQKQERQRTPSAADKALAQIRELKREMKEAVEVENFERAVQIQAELKELGDHP